MSVSIETITAQGRALVCMGIWGLETSLLPAPGPGMGVKPHAQTCVPWAVMAGSGVQASSGCKTLCPKKKGTVAQGVGHVLPSGGQVSLPTLPGHTSSYDLSPQFPTLGVHGVLHPCPCLVGTLGRYQHSPSV